MKRLDIKNLPVKKEKHGAWIVRVDMLFPNTSSLSLINAVLLDQQNKTTIQNSPCPIQRSSSGFLTGPAVDRQIPRCLEARFGGQLWEDQEANKALLG